MEKKDDNFEKMFKAFTKEFISKGFEQVGNTATSFGKQGIDELTDLFEEFKKKWEGETEETVDVDVTEISKELEIKYLKEQVELLKQQLKDKDELIKLLQKQGKKKKQE